MWDSARAFCETIQASFISFMSETYHKWFIHFHFREKTSSSSHRLHQLAPFLVSLRNHPSPISLNTVTGKSWHRWHRKRTTNINAPQLCLCLQELVLEFQNQGLNGSCKLSCQETTQTLLKHFKANPVQQTFLCFLSTQLPQTSSNL